MAHRLLLLFFKQKILKHICNKNNQINQEQNNQIGKGINHGQPKTYKNHESYKYILQQKIKKKKGLTCQGKTKRIKETCNHKYGIKQVDYLNMQSKAREEDNHSRNQHEAKKNANPQGEYM